MNKLNNKNRNKNKYIDKIKIELKLQIKNSHYIIGEVVWPRSRYLATF